MNLYTDDNPEFTISGLSFKDASSAKLSITKIERVINDIKRKQRPGLSPSYLHPRRLLSTPADIYRFYEQQKMLRVLAMLNRARVLYRRTHSNSILGAIRVYEEWMSHYKRALNSAIDNPRTRMAS